MSKYCTIHTILWYNSCNTHFYIVWFMSTSNMSLCYGSFCKWYNTYRVSYHINKWQLWTHTFKGVHESSLCLTCNRPDLIGSKKIQPTVHRKWGSNWVVQSLIKWRMVQSALEKEMDKMKMKKIQWDLIRSVKDLTKSNEILPNPMKIWQNLAEILPNMAKVLPNMAKVLPNLAEISPNLMRSC